MSYVSQGPKRRSWVISSHILALQEDRKRLKAEKIELLNQMKEVFLTLECKERELRDFIRQYEQKMKDSDKGLKEVISTPLVIPTSQRFM